MARTIAHIHIHTYSIRILTIRTVLKFSEAWEIYQGAVDSHMYGYTLNKKTIFHRTSTAAGRLQHYAGDMKQYLWLLL